jgi:hypothetical protein
MEQMASASWGMRWSRVRRSRGQEESENEVQVEEHVASKAVAALDGESTHRILNWRGRRRR